MKVEPLVVRLWSYGLALALGAGLLQACLNPRPEDFPSSGGGTPSDSEVDTPIEESPNIPLGPPEAPGASPDVPDVVAPPPVPADAGPPGDAGAACSADAAATDPGGDGGSAVPE